MTGANIGAVTTADELAVSQNGGIPKRPLNGHTGTFH